MATYNFSSTLKKNNIWARNTNWNAARNRRRAISYLFRYIIFVVIFNTDLWGSFYSNCFFEHEKNQKEVLKKMKWT